MRVLAAAACGLMAAAVFAAGALAQPSGPTWSDPQGRLSLTLPNRGWGANDPQALRGQDGQMGGSFYVQLAVGSDICHVFYLVRPETAERSVASVREGYTRPLDAAPWQTLANDAKRISQAQGDVSLGETSVDTSGFWPVQRATINVGQMQITAALQGRPGLELQIFCHVWPELIGEEQPNIASYNTIIASIATARDGEWRAATETPAPGAPPQPTATTPN